MTIASVGGQTAGRPELTKAAASMAAQVKKPLGDFAEDPASSTGTTAPSQGWLGVSDAIAALFGDRGSAATTTTVSAVSVSVEITSTVSLLTASSKDSPSSAVAGARQKLSAALQKQQDADDKLLGTLQEFLDGWKEFNKQSFAAPSWPQRQTGAPKKLNALLAGLGLQA